MNFKRVIKTSLRKLYKRIRYFFSKKINHTSNIIKISPQDTDSEYFFGYYDQSPWDASGKYILCMEANDTWKNVTPNRTANIILIDNSLPMGNKDRVRTLANTHAWNVQQGCMAQWLGPDYSKEIIFNDYRDNEFCSIILNINNGNYRKINMPVYAVSPKGNIAFSLDFTRLHSLRPGYGYSNKVDTTKGIGLPNDYCLWKIDLVNNTRLGILKYRDIYNFNHKESMEGAMHKINHIMINPSCNRIMFLHRWYKDGEKYTRLLTCNPDGGELYCLSDDSMVSHCFWKDDSHILAFEHKNSTGDGYYLMKDKTNEYIQLWSDLTSDGHPSYSPDRKFVITDTYPNFGRVSSVFLLNEVGYVNVVAQVYSPFKYDGVTRCDLHPRWNRTKNEICFDSVFEGKRGLYKVELDEYCNDK